MNDVAIRRQVIDLSTVNVAARQPQIPRTLGISH